MESSLLGLCELSSFFVFTNVGYISIFKIVNFFTIQKKILPKMGFEPICLFSKTTDFKSVAYSDFATSAHLINKLYHKRTSLSRKLPYLFCLFTSENRSSAIGKGITVMWLLWCFFQGTTEKHLYFSHTNFKLARHRISTDHSWTRFNLNASFERHFHSWKTSICKLILSTQ